MGKAINTISTSATMKTFLTLLILAASTQAMLRPLGFRQQLLGDTPGTLGDCPAPENMNCVNWVVTWHTVPAKGVTVDASIECTAAADLDIKNVRVATDL